ncbi:hypothetical protein KW790_00145 [Candidatus Parcubacteria bacterium]|nr:hypothetical protein [Candidatus Parcubacteria bacterium]
MDAIPGWKPLIICGKTTGEFIHSCGFHDLVVVTNNLITDLVLLSTLVVVILTVVTGIRLITSQGNPAALKKAKDTGMSVIIGYIVILVAWLVIYTIIHTLFQNPDSYSILGNP